jgi:hypothetical protein
VRLKESALREQVDRLLWEEWDPIGVRAMGGPDDEYRSYVGGVVQLLLDGADATRIADHLGRLRTQSMGLPASLERDRRVADRLVALVSAK